MEARRSETETSVGAGTPAIDEGPGPKDLTFGAGILGLIALVAIALGIILSVT